MNLCPFCNQPVKVMRILIGEGAYFVCCTNHKCAAQWPREVRRYQAVENYALWTTPQVVTK